MDRFLRQASKILIYASFVLAAILLSITLSSCPGMPRGGTEAWTAAQILMSILDVPDSSLVLFTGPVEAGTIVRENDIANGDPVELTLPEAPGSYYVFLIDSEPGKMFEHPVQYAWVELNGETSGSVDSNHWMTVIRPGRNPAPFKPVEYQQMQGVDFYFVEGEGGADIEDYSHKALSQQLNSRRPTAKTALVADGGDKKGMLEGAGIGLLKYSYIAGDLAEGNADPAADYLDSNGFDVDRYSQYWGNSHPYFENGQELLDTITGYGQYYTDLGPPDSVCDEFFIYITAHGYADNGAFEIHPPDGSGNFSVVAYSQVYEALKSFPEWTKVTVFFDNCYGGAAISQHQALLDEVAGRLCALTVITSVDGAHSAWAPSTVHDSGTQDFMEGSDKDHDGDGNVGDIQDRFLEMKDQGSWLGPLSYHKPENTSWCSLDGESTTYTPTPSALIETDKAELVFTHIVTVTDCPQAIGSITISNPGNEVVHWSYVIEDGFADMHFDFSPYSGTLQPGESVMISVQFNCYSADVGDTVVTFDATTDDGTRQESVDVTIKPTFEWP